MKKKILFCGNGMSAEILKELHKMFSVCVITEFIHDNGLKYADKVVFANTKNYREALETAKKVHKEGFNFDAVLSLCWDCPMSVAAIAEEFNLFGISFDVAKNSTIKSLRSNLFQKHCVPAPKYCLCKTFLDVIDAINNIGLPVVLKPITQSSSKGVILVEDMEYLASAYRYCLRFSGDNQVLVNEFIKGTEFSTEGLMVNGVFHLTGISERLFHYKKYKPFFVEIGDVMPVKLNKEEVELFRKNTEKAALALSIDKGIVKGDLIYTNEKKIIILEITPRLGGPRFGTEMVPLNNGTNILLAMIQQALGEEINNYYLNAHYNKGVVNRAIFPKEGIIEKIVGLDIIKNLPGYYDFKWFRDMPLHKGDIIYSPQNMCGGVGYIIATGATRNEAVKNADLIEENLIIKTKGLNK